MARPSCRERFILLCLTFCTLLNLYLWRVHESLFPTPNEAFIISSTAQLSTHRFDPCLCGIVAYFNPAGYKSRVENYRRFRRSSAAQGLWLLVVELSFGGGFELKEEDADLLLQIEGSRRQVMWQKERLLNVALHKLPAFCSSVTWPDAEVVFGNEFWVKETCVALQRFPVVQPFAAVYRLPPRVHRVREFVEEYGNDLSIGTDKSNGSIAVRGFAYAVQMYGKGRKVVDSQREHGFTGFAWAARREVIEKIGFYDKSVVGGGDALMAHAFVGHVAASSLQRAGSGGVEYVPYYYRKRFARGLERFEQSFGEYALRAYQLIEGNVSFVDGIAFHLWHGSKHNRQYEERFRILKKARFDPSNDIEVDENGAWKWASFDRVKLRMHEEVDTMFKKRQEDDE